MVKRAKTINFELVYNMTKEERSKWYHDWYWNRGGREQTLRRRRENGFLKVGSLKPGKPKMDGV